MRTDNRFDYTATIRSIHASPGRRICSAILRPLVIGFSMLSLAQMLPTQANEIAPYVGHRFGGNFEDTITSTTFKIGDAASAGLVLDFDLERDKQIEILISRQNTHLSTGDPLFTPNPLFDLTVDYYHIGGLYMLPDGERVRPFLTGTFGLTQMSPKRDGYSTENRFSLSLGAGAKIFFSKNLGMRVDMRGFYTVLDSSSEVFCSGGCLIKLSSSGFVQTDFSAALLLRF